jgi:quercetin dioxygenase-like cupin family protein
MVQKSNQATILRPLGDRIVDAPFVKINITSLLEQITNERPWRKSDRNAITVFKTDGMSMVLIALHKGAEMVEQTVSGLVNVQVLKGRIIFNKGKEAIKLDKGQVLILHEGISHRILAKKKTFFLLTITTKSGENNSHTF